MTRTPPTTLAVAADYADAMLVARRAKNLLFLLIFFSLLAQISIFFLARYASVVQIRPADVATTGQRIVAALLLVALDLLIVLVGHALLEAFQAFGDVAHHCRETVPAEKQQEDDREDQDMPNAETAHEDTPLAAYLVALLFAFQLKLEDGLVERVQ